MAHLLSQTSNLLSDVNSLHIEYSINNDVGNLASSELLRSFTIVETLRTTEGVLHLHLKA